MSSAEEPNAGGQSTRGSKGAAALLGMFEPPPGAATTPSEAPKSQNNDVKEKEKDAATNDDHISGANKSTINDLDSSERRRAEIASFSAFATRGQNGSYSEGFPEANSGTFHQRPSPVSSKAAVASGPLLDMFSPPQLQQQQKTPSKKKESPGLTSIFESPDRKSTTPTKSNSSTQLPDYNINSNQRSSLASTLRHANNNNVSPLVENNAVTENTSLLQSMFLSEDDQTPKPSKVVIHYNTNTDNASSMDRLSAPPLIEQFVPLKGGTHRRATNDNATNRFNWSEFRKNHLQPSTFAGACMFCLYHIVFSLAFASAQIRPHGQTPIIGEMAKLVCVGIFFGGPFYIYRLNKDVPALYPSVDLFLAPFLASAAARIDQTLFEDGYDGSNNEIFFASYAVLTAIGMFSAGVLLLLAATFKLANLGTFLPYSVLCGFFSAVGVLLWALAFSVDTNGLTWQHVFFSGDTKLILHSLLHHLPSLTVGILMNILGPKHPFYVILLIIITIVVFYSTMFITGLSLEEAQEEKWFWSKEELSIPPMESEESWLDYWAPPLPFGHLGSILQNHVHWGAVKSGLSDMFALAFLYLLRSSIHASAMKKNVNNLVCRRRVPKSNQPAKRRHKKEPSYAQAAMDAFSYNVRLVNESLTDAKKTSGSRQSLHGPKSPNSQKTSNNNLNLEGNDEQSASAEYDYIEERPKPCRKGLQDIFVDYGRALMIVSFSGGYGTCPTVATSNTMYAIGAGGAAPQYGSILLLIIFYLTDFDLVRYIPKACFSSLLVLGAVDTFVVWFFLAYKKTQDILEWLVVPFIVLFSLIVGFLNAVFLGVGISTFVFVAAFFRVGIVKFNATGLEIRSTIERSLNVADWLVRHGDYIQVLVLQNYLFFGNASSILAYIATMFEDVDMSDEPLGMELPPKPKVLIIDMSLITGLDTSTLDIFAEIKELCKNNDCKLYLCGVSSRVKKGLALTGVKQETGLKENRTVRFLTDLDIALGIAEDYISAEVQAKQKSANTSNMGKGWGGFQAALKLIDQQHDQEFSKELLDLEPYTSVVELEAGDRLFASEGAGEDRERGLFFIESGFLKIERDATETLTRGRSTLNRNRNDGTISHLHARAGTLGRQRAAIKSTTRESMTQTFRLARIGPGWVCGAIEGASGLRNAGVHVAVTKCRVHHLPFQKMEKIEAENPKLMLGLYKMLSHLMSRRQEITIGQLATFHSIMSSPAHSKPVNRAAMMAMRR